MIASKIVHTTRSFTLSTRSPCRQPLRIPLTRGYRAASPHPPLSFVFDIDGVLLRGSTVLPEAKRALTILEGDNPFRTKIPYILVTNGGGSSEEERCRRLTEQLGFEISTSQIIQCHTIMQALASDYANEPVLVLGGKRDTIRKVAEGYGFHKALTTLDVKAWNENVWPFYDLSPEERASTKSVDFSNTPIRSIFVFHDPRNWALDAQIMVDLIMGGGIIGAPYVHPEKRAPEERVKVTFCNPDLQWGANFDRPRLGQGAFRVAFQAVFKGLTGGEYPYIQYGKPTTATYKFAEDVLRSHYAKVLGRPMEESCNVYMIGDNPESDIAGANATGWSSVLVRTGVYDGSTDPPTHTPTHIADHVEEAVNWAISRELSKSRQGV